VSESLPAHLRQLRRAGKRAEALALLQAALAQRADANLARWAWQHQAFWWAPVQGPRVTLRRRGPQDVALLRRCWSDTAFMARFHRLAAPLPASDDALRDLLLREHWALPEESGALHWSVELQGRAVGFISVVEWSLPHRRAEYLIGLPEAAGAWTAVEASHLALGWLARQAQLERLSANFYADNLVALRQAEHLGFEREGVLRGHLRGADGQRSDLHLAGLLLDAAYFTRHERIRRRLLGAAA
jgi:RimJ/RimL family protein N-acetyltransferase